MKRILLYFTVFSFIINSLLFGASFDSYPKSLNEPIRTLLSFPKAQELLQAAENRAGKIKIRLKPFSFSTQSAMWNPGNHSIILHPRLQNKEGNVIRLILFELHNAKNEYKFHRIDDLAERRAISRENYIRAVEYVEYQNAIETIALLNEGIAKGYYPSTARWYVYQDFEQHYALQKKSGHSQFIGTNYDKLIS